MHHQLLSLPELFEHQLVFHVQNRSDLGQNPSPRLVQYYNSQLLKSNNES